MLSHAAKALLVYAATAAPIESMPSCAERVFRADMTQEDGSMPAGPIDELFIGDELTISTLNVKSGERGIQAVAEELADQDSDVICGQEVEESNVEPISRTVGMPNYEQGWARLSDGEPFGNVTFSKSKITDSYEVALPRLYDEQRVLLVTKHERNGESFYVFNTHLTPKNFTAELDDANKTVISERDLQAMYINSELRRLPATTPVFFCGDLNAVPESSTYAMMMEGRFVDGVRIFGDNELETFAGSKKQIDYILSNGQGWLFIEVRTFGKQTTDHCGVEGRFVKIIETVEA